MTQPLPTALDQLLVKPIASSGTPVPTRPYLNLASGFTVVDNPNFTVNGQVVGSTDVTPSGVAGGGQNAVTLANGLNSNIATNNLATVRISGPSAGFSVGGFALNSAAAPSAGQQLVVVNTASQAMTVVDEDGSSTAVYRITTPGGVNVTLPAGESAALFTYDGTSSRWVLVAISPSPTTPLPGQQTVTLSNGLNSNAAITSATVRVTGPSAAFSIGGLALSGTPASGQQITVVNTTANTMTLVQEDPASTAKYRLSVGSGQSVTVPPYAAASLVYDGAASRWLVQNIGLVRPKEFNVRDFGATGNGKLVLDAAMSSTTSVVTSATASFTAADVGKLATIYAAGSSTVYAGTITAYTSATQVSVSFTNSGSSITGGLFQYGSDDSAAIDATIAAASVAAPVFVLSPSVYFPPGIYCRTTAMSLTSAQSGLTFQGASSRTGANATLSKIVAMSGTLAYFVQLNQASCTFQDLYFAGNRVCTETFRLYANTATSTVLNYFNRCRFDGGITYVVHLAGPSEIDNTEFLNCYIYGDFFDITYRPVVGLFDDNPQAFQWSWYGGAFYGCQYLIEYASGASVSIDGAQFGFWNNAAIRVQTVAAQFVVNNAYSEGVANYFLRIDPTAGADALGTVTLRDCNIQDAPIYTAHTNRLVIERGIYGADIYSDPAAATFSGLAYGVLPVFIDGATLANGADIVYTSGVPGQLVQKFNCINQGTSNLTVTDGVVTGTTSLSTVSSSPFTNLLYGSPVQVLGAGPAGSTLNTWITSVANSKHATMKDAASTSSTGTTVVIGNAGWWNGTEYFVPSNFSRSPGEAVQDGTTLNYDANGLVLGVGVAPIQSGVIIPADFHQITGLSADRSYLLSSWGVNTGAHMRVYNNSAGGHQVTIVHPTNGTIARLLPDQYADLQYGPNSGWVVFATNSRERTTTGILNTTVVAGNVVALASVSITPVKSTACAITAQLGSSASVVWGASTMRLIIYAGTTAGGIGSASEIYDEVLNNSGSATTTSFGAASLATGLTPGTSYTFWLAVFPTGGNYTTGAALPGGISAREVSG